MDTAQTIELIDWIEGVTNDVLMPLSHRTWDIGKTAEGYGQCSVRLLDMLKGMTCEDEGCPHYGTPHGHGAAVMAPEGYVLVPKEPTPEMLKEIRLVEGYSDYALKVRYQALLEQVAKARGEIS